MKDCFSLKGPQCVGREKEICTTQWYECLQGGTKGKKKKEGTELWVRRGGQNL